MIGRPFISPLRVPLMTTRPTAFSPLSKKKPADIRPTSIEVAWPITAGLGVKVLNEKSSGDTFAKLSSRREDMRTTYFFTFGTLGTKVFPSFKPSMLVYCFFLSPKQIFVETIFYKNKFYMMSREMSKINIRSKSNRILPPIKLCVMNSGAMCL
ncbi:hypothetical protein AVEN_26795-1 [Araneus ventricosus]|uniref:Uncharacterized protein n=1 Tax=Araneus ventricosus TaxID=182803 RepID=A0A4Y2WVE7_ARAVE|nr:hypothetical protein AVEN_26795-1 [Araneus ventricosus]